MSEPPVNRTQANQADQRGTWPRVDFPQTPCHCPPRRSRSVPRPSTPAIACRPWQSLIGRKRRGSGYDLVGIARRPTDEPSERGVGSVQLCPGGGEKRIDHASEAIAGARHLRWRNVFRAPLPVLVDTPLATAHRGVEGFANDEGDLLIAQSNSTSGRRRCRDGASRRRRSSPPAVGGHRDSRSVCH